MSKILEKLTAAEQECKRLGGSMKGGMVMAAIGPLVGMLFGLLREMISEIEELKRRRDGDK